MSVRAFELPMQMLDAVNAFQLTGQVLIYKKYPSSVHRFEMRENIRALVAQLLERQASASEVDIQIDNQRGVSPEVLVNGRRIFLSISHCQDLSIAAISRHGDVGVDIVDVREIAATDDLLQTAAIFLSPIVVSSLTQLSGDNFVSEFCMEWVKREASLKCLGLPMREWEFEAQSPAINLFIESNRLDTSHIFAIAYALHN